MEKLDSIQLNAYKWLSIYTYVKIIMLIVLVKRSLKNIQKLSILQRKSQFPNMLFERATLLSNNR